MPSPGGELSERCGSQARHIMHRVTAAGGALFAQAHSGKLPLEVAMEKAELRGRYGGRDDREEEEKEGGWANYVTSVMEILEGLRRGPFAEAKMINIRAVLGRCVNAGRLRAEEFPLRSSPLFLQWLFLLLSHKYPNRKWRNDESWRRTFR